jgi:hypothetical protein
LEVGFLAFGISVTTMSEFLHQDRLFALLDAVCEERASADELVELERLVQSSPEARWLYLSYIDLHGTLLWDAAGGLGVAPGVMPAVGVAATEQPVTTVHRQHRRSARLVAACAAVCLFAVVGLWWGNRPAADNFIANNGESTEIVAPEHPTPSPTGRGPVQLPGTKIEPTNKIDAVVANPPTPTIDEASPSVVAHNSAAGSSQRVVAAIDGLLRDSWQRVDVTPAPRADDAEWVRRIYLHLAGRIPTVTEAERFLADAHAHKRPRLIDALLDDSAYARNFTTIWSKLLVGRSPNPQVNRPALEKYLRMSFAANRPWNEMVADFVSAEGRTDENGAANFLVAHLNNQAVPATAITARLFLGEQIQCAQCHNNPLNDTKQTAFWEFNSLFQQTDVVGRSRREPQMNSSRGMSAELVSRTDAGGPIYYETLNGLMKVAFPRYEGREIDPSPQVNRRQELARLMTSGDRPQLAAAFVNRIWAHLLGAGFTRPVDDMGPHNPPSHPELLALLGEEFIRSGYDVKQLVRWICQSEAYQLSSRQTGKDDELDTGDVLSFRQVYVQPLSAEQLYDSLLTATQAHQAGARDWAAAERQRQEWLERFVISLQNDENDEADTLSGTHAQALMLMNGELVDEALSLAPGTFLNDLVRDRASETEKIRRLCLAALSRPPTAKELPAMQKVVREGGLGKPRPAGSRPVATPSGFQDLFWALLNSNEFALVH